MELLRSRVVWHNNGLHVKACVENSTHSQTASSTARCRLPSGAITIFHDRFSRRGGAGSLMVAASPWAGYGETVEKPLRVLTGELAFCILWTFPAFLSGRLMYGRHCFSSFGTRVRLSCRGWLVSSLFVALIIGPLVSTLDLAATFSHPETGRFVVQTS